MRALTLCLGLVFALAAPVSVYAEDCNTYTAQSDLNACAARAYDRADAELNAVYAAVKKQADEDASTVKLLVSAQRAWIIFRDAECAFSASDSEGGSIHPMLISNCMEEMTRKRTAELRAYLSCEEGDLSCPVPKP